MTDAVAAFDDELIAAVRSDRDGFRAWPGRHLRHWPRVRIRVRLGLWLVIQLGTHEEYETQYLYVMQCLYGLTINQFR